MTSRCEPGRPSAEGFTLLEVLLAMMIAGILLTTVYGAVSRTLASKQTAEERAELYASGREAVLKMADEIEGALHPEAGGTNFFIGSGGGAGNSFVQFITMDRGGYGASGMRSGRIMVEYFLDPLPNQRGLFTLFRRKQWFQALLAKEGLAPLPVEMEEDDPALESVALPLLDCPESVADLDLPGSCIRVVNLDFGFYDEIGGRYDEWTSVSEDNEAMYERLPAAVAITLVLADERGVEHPFETVVDLPLAKGQPTPGPEGEGDDEDEDEDDDLEEDHDSAGTTQPGGRPALGGGGRSR
jgi:prepilin-type N-terminal cleavage/methylation domain-containing protein